MVTTDIDDMFLRKLLIDILHKVPPGEYGFYVRAPPEKAKEKYHVVGNEWIIPIKRVLEEIVPEYTGGLYKFHIIPPGSPDSTKAFATLEWRMSYDANGSVLIHYDENYISIVGFDVTLIAHLIHPDYCDKCQWVFTKEVINGLTGVGDLIPGQNIPSDPSKIPEEWKYSAWYQGSDRKHPHMPELEDIDKRWIGVVCNLPNLWHCNVRGY